MIFNMTGGTVLNFTVSINPRPENPSENTLYINTDTQIPKYVISPNPPANPINGEVWVYNSGSGNISFSAIKKNEINLNPVAVYQWLSGKWVQKESEFYQNGEWLELLTYIFNNGNVNESLTGGINGTIQGNNIYFNASVSPSNNKTYTTKNTIDLTNAKSIKCEFTSPNTVEDVYFRISVLDASKNGENVTTSNLVAYVGMTSPFANAKYEVTLDISGIKGSHYIGYSWGVNSSASNAKDITGRIQRWWLE